MPNPIKRIRGKRRTSLKQKFPKFDDLVETTFNDALVDWDEPLVRLGNLEPDHPERISKTYTTRKGYCRCNVCGHKYVEGMHLLDPDILESECCKSTQRITDPDGSSFLVGGCECCSQWCT